MGSLLLFCFKYRVKRLPFFQLEKNITLTTYLHKARTFLLLNSFTNIIYGEVLQNSIETKMAEYEVLLNDLEMQKRNTNQSAAIN